MKTTISIIVLAAAIVIGYLLFAVTNEENNNPAPTATVPSATATPTPAVSSSPTPTATATPAPQTHTITYTGSVFEPGTLTIQTGDTVTFKNTSSGPMWVASDPHPIHTDFSDFDARKTYGPGENYSFTFRKIGTWGYHNHSKPNILGKIIVR